MTDTPLDGERDHPSGARRLADRIGRSDQATRIGRYRILERIGQGATAAVYRALDEESGRDVALKLLLTDLEGEEQIRTRFLREVEIARLLRHRNLVTVFDAGEIDGRFYLAMELLGGVTLREYLTLKPALPLEDKLDLMVQLCEGLAVAHDHDIYHRDLKPSNLFIREDGALKILDFGIARLASSSMTVAGLLMGTPDFMSPEQARGADIDHRSDIFSAGAVLYFVLSGRKPFPGAQLPNVLHKVEHEEPVALDDREAPPRLARIVAKALAKAPSARYPHVRAFLRDLIECRREYMAATRQVSARSREQVGQARAISERARALGRVLGVPETEQPGDDLLAFTGFATRHPALADRGAAMLAWAPMRRALAVDVGGVLKSVIDERQALVREWSGAAEQVEAAGRAAAAGDHARAIELAERALAGCPSSATARQIVDRARQQVSAQDGAVRQRRAVEAVTHARRAIAHGEWAAAEGHLVRARELDAQTPDFAAVQDELHTRRAAVDDARRDSERQHRADIDALLTTARDALARGDAVEALRAAAAVLAREPGHTEADRLRTEASSAQRSAADRSERASRFATHVERARAHLRAGRFDEARADAQQALAIDPAHEAAAALLASATRGAVDARRAREAPAIAVRAAAAAGLFLGHAQRALLLGDLEQARGLAETALAIDAANADARAVLDRARQAIEQLGDHGPPPGRDDPDATLVLPLPSAWTRLGAPLLAWPPRRAVAADGGPAAPPPGAHRLRIVRVSGPSRDVALAPRRYRVGRAADNEIVLDDPSHTVSRVHAELQPGRGGYVLVDCDSDHGVWVDGERVERVTLEPDVPVVIGPYRLVIDDGRSPSSVDSTSSVSASAGAPASSGTRRPASSAVKVRS